MYLFVLNFKKTYLKAPTRTMHMVTVILGAVDLPETHVYFLRPNVDSIAAFSFKSKVLDFSFIRNKRNVRQPFDDFLFKRNFQFSDLNEEIRYLFYVPENNGNTVQYVTKSDFNRMSIENFH